MGGPTKGRLLASQSFKFHWRNLLGVSPRSSQRLRIPLPNFSSQLTDDGCAFGCYDYYLAGRTDLFGPPEIAEDGSLRIEFTIQRNLDALSHVNNPNGYCDRHTVQYSSQVQLWNVKSDGTYTSSVVTTLSGTVDCQDLTHDYYCPYHKAIPGEVIPDGSDGSLASWKDEISGLNGAPHDVLHVSDIANGGTSDFTLSSLQPPRGYYSWIPMVLGENSVAFASNGQTIAAFNTSGQTLWTHAAPSQRGASLILSAAGGGLTAKTTTGGVDTVRRFDPSGALTTDSWTGSNLDYYIGNLWFGSPSSGPALIAYSAGAVDLANSPWFAFGMMGSRMAIPNLNVTNPSNQGPNQNTISSILQKKLTALPNNATCNSGLQGAGSMAGVSGSSLIQAQLQANSFGHGAFNILAEAAVSGNLNADRSSIGVPVSYAFTVNDQGPFFNATDILGRHFSYGPRNYHGGTLKAQAAILLHEYGHQLTITGFQHDVGVPKAQNANNDLVDKNCRQLIEGIQ
jgi:hypothetical protein